MIEPADAIAGLMRLNATVAAAFTTSGLVAIYSDEIPEHHGRTAWQGQDSVTPTAVINVVPGQALEQSEALIFDGEIEIAIYANSTNSMRTLANTIHTNLDTRINPGRTAVAAASATVHQFEASEPTDFENLEMNTGIKYALATYRAYITPSS